MFIHRSGAIHVHMHVCVHVRMCACMGVHVRTCRIAGNFGKVFNFGELMILRKIAKFKKHHILF